MCYFNVEIVSNETQSGQFGSLLDNVTSPCLIRSACTLSAADKTKIIFFLGFISLIIFVKTFLIR